MNAAAEIADALLRDLTPDPEGDGATVVLPHDRDALIGGISRLLTSGAILPGAPATGAEFTPRYCAEQAAALLAHASRIAGNERVLAETAAARAAALTAAAAGWRDLGGCMSVNLLMLHDQEGTDHR